MDESYVQFCLDEKAKGEAYCLLRQYEEVSRLLPWPKEQRRTCGIHGLGGGEHGRRNR